MIEVELKTWDAAAPTVIVEEAGGRVTDYGGHRDIAAGTIVASNGRLHETVLERLRAG